MANSRKRPRKPDPADQRLLAALDRALADAAEPISAPAAPVRQRETVRARRSEPPAAPVVIAFSGGPDSTVLLDLACRMRGAAKRRFASLHAVHVHHGLLQEADAWAAHCQKACAQREVALTVCRVAVRATRGIEDGAREARYQALIEEAHRLGAGEILTAHHADDRIETFLLQWLRGAGPAGLAGIARAREGAFGVRIVRPLLDATRADIEAYIQRHGLASVEDPSNQDLRLARNVLRRQVLPVLGRIRPGYRASTVRSIELVGEAAELLRAVSLEDLAACARDAPEGMLRIDRLAALPALRRAPALRAWLERSGIQAPARARLLEIIGQALGAGGASRMLVRLGSREVRRHRGLLCLRAVCTVARTHERLQWHGEPRLPVRAWGGSLHFIADDALGFDPDWLRERPLDVRARSGGERFKPHALRPSKSLKHLFQEAGVPEFERAGLPLVWRDDRLIFVPRLGADARLVESGGRRVRLEWHGEASLIAEDEDAPADSLGTL